MRKNIFLLIMSITIVISVSSCNSDKDEQQLEISQSEIPNKKESSYSLLDYTPNIYYNFLKKTDNTVGFSSLKPGPLQSFSVVQNSNISDNINKGNLVINSLSLTNKNGTSKINKNNADNIFGKTMKITVNSKKGTTFKDGSTNKEVEMYVPEQLEISSPKISTEEELMPICFYEDFVLEWNADPKNKEGLVVIAEYNGLSAVPSENKNIHIVNTDVIKNDNGRTILNNNIWDGIPNSGIVNITLLRGNVKIENIDEENYKFFAEAHVVLPIILIKDLAIVE